MTLQEFAFSCPLYNERVIDLNLKAVLVDMMSGGTVDGHCVYCERDATFRKRFSRDSDLENSIIQEEIIDKSGIFSLHLRCTRAEHVYVYYFHLSGLNVEKIGQLPSVADIAQGEFSRYKSLSKDDSSELYKAVGLAAHGVGIGAFVYLRRVFERLIQQRFENAHQDLPTSHEEFMHLRMSEKIACLSNQLPSFLVENRAIYGILSSGVHELSEKNCLNFFDVMKQSIAMILDEDQKKREENSLKASLASAIKSFKPSTITPER